MAWPRQRKRSERNPKARATVFGVSVKPTVGERERRNGRTIATWCVLSLALGCSTTVDGPQGDPTVGGVGATGGTLGMGSGGLSSGGRGGVPGMAAGSAGVSGASGSGVVAGNAGSTAATGGTGGTGAPAQCADQAAITPGRAPLRRLTIPEYNNTVRDVIGETSNPAFAFPAETLGNGFGNDALQQWVTPGLASEYIKAAEAIAQRVTSSSATLSQLLPCASQVSTGNAASCARTFIDSWVPKAYRRPLLASEVDELVALFDDVQTIVAEDTTATVEARFASGIGAIIEAALVTPDFLYKPEFGSADAANPGVMRPTGPEMATRLSYLFRATVPDDELTRAAQAGELATSEGVRAQAERLVNEPAAREVVSYFFENIVPTKEINDTPRDAKQYPMWSSAVGVLMQQETATFLDYEIFDPAGSGTWPGILTAPYTFVNQALASYYGMPAVTGDTFRRVDVDTTQRLGYLTQGGVMAGLTHSNHTNPVTRGAYIVNQLMCRGIQLPSNIVVMPPDPYSAPTTRERFSLHSASPSCAGCHAQLDPLGFALENFDAVGLYRATENGVTIDASGEVPDMPGGDFGTCASGIACAGKEDGTRYQTACNGSCATELVRRLATNTEVMACFPQRWLDYAYGQSLLASDPDDVCNREALTQSFVTAGYNVKKMLVELTQTDGFLYLGARE
jgi:hypothetical protein